MCSAAAQLLGPACGGFLSEGEFRDGEKISYRLVHIPTGESRPLASRISEDIDDPDKTRYGLSYWFSPRAFSWARDLIFRDLAAGVPVLCVDEVGPVELQNCGFYDILRPQFCTGETALLLSVRSSLTVQVLNHILLKEAVIVPLKDMLHE